MSTLNAAIRVVAEVCFVIVQVLEVAVGNLEIRRLSHVISRSTATRLSRLWRHCLALCTETVRQLELITKF